ncbi:MAG TPA: cytochrome c [Sphingomicrobium sp.]|nr:cytochrome c [Sphingomicrobium sp.]
MNRYLATAAALFVLTGVSASSQPTGMGPGMMGRWGSPGPWMMANMARHHQAMMYGIPKPYDAARDPTPSTSEKLSRGGAVFAQNCASCHGPAGRGDGPAGATLSPPPANLAWLAQMPMSRSDPYMDWTVSEGGKAFQSAMPSFKDTLSASDRWAVIAYVRAGLPSSPPR